MTSFLGVTNWLMPTSTYRYVMTFVETSTLPEFCLQPVVNTFVRVLAIAYHKVTYV